MTALDLVRAISARARELADLPLDDYLRGIGGNGEVSYGEFIEMILTKEFDQEARRLDVGETHERHPEPEIAEEPMLINVIRRGDIAARIWKEGVEYEVTFDRPACEGLNTDSFRLADLQTLINVAYSAKGELEWLETTKRKGE